MSKQTKPIDEKCSTDACQHTATYGIYAFDGEQTDVNLDKPQSVVCGKHKPHLNRDQSLRLVKLRVSK